MNYVMALDDLGKGRSFWNHTDFITSLQMHLGHKKGNDLSKAMFNESEFRHEPGSPHC